MELKSNPGTRFSPSEGHPPLDPGLTAVVWGTPVLSCPLTVGTAERPQSSVVSTHFCFKATSSGKGGAELVTASTKNGAGGEISENPSFCPHPSSPANDAPHPASPLERAALCGIIHRGVIMDAEDTWGVTV